MALPSNTKRKVFDGRYEVLSIVGRGTDSVVYHARHVQGSEQEVALKVLLNQKHQVSLSERLRKEALTLVSCRHKYVVRLDDFHSVDDLCYLSMEFARDGDLRKVLAALGSALPPERGERYLRQCLEALDFIHATGVIHRDIKPENILVLNQDEIRLADFGIALLPGDAVDISELQKGVGSFSYLPPELVQGIRYDDRSDLYSLGLCFYEALAGFHPFEKLPLAEQLDARLDGRIAPLHEIQPGVSRHLSGIISKLIRYDADERFQTALEALRALDNKSFALAEPAPAAAAVASLSPEPAPSAPPPAQEPLARAAGEPAAAPEWDLPPEEPSNDDFGQPQDAEPAGRTAQPTEEFDIERIKQIIEKHSEQKAESAARRAKRGTAVPAPGAPAAPPKQDRYALKPKEAKGREQGKKPAKPVRQPATVKTSLRRLALVGLSAAAITVLSIVLMQQAPKLSLASLKGLMSRTATEEPPALEESGHDATSMLHPGDVAADPAALAFPNIPGGLYSGGIEGVIPGVRSPIALISLPNESKVAVIIGVEGWAPSSSSTTDDGAVESHSLMVRSNGVILNLTGELSGDSIAGTFTNTMTGETGTWSVRKAS